MTEEAISRLRQRMIDDMTIRGLVQKTQNDYIRAVKNFTRFFGVSPDQASFEDIRRFQLQLREQGVGVPTINLTVSALRFLFKVTLRMIDVDSERMVIRVEQGQGKKDRYVMLSPYLLDLLRSWRCEARPTTLIRP